MRPIGRARGDPTVPPAGPPPRPHRLRSRCRDTSFARGRCSGLLARRTSGPDALVHARLCGRFGGRVFRGGVSSHAQAYVVSVYDTAVVLSGGGMNGVLMEAGFLRRLRQSPLWDRVGWVFGTSAGALSGSMATLDRHG